MKNYEPCKTFLTSAVRLVILKREIEGHPSFIDSDYLESKSWRSPLDFRANRDLVALLRALPAYSEAEIRAFYKEQGLEGPFALEDRAP